MTNVKSRKVHVKCRGLMACLFTTAFLFCFGLFALYKYTLIDVDAVLLSGSFDVDDYGIDVSGLRAVTSYSDKQGKMTSQVDKWDAVVRDDGGVRMGYVTDDCDNPKELYGVAYLTKNKHGGIKVVVIVNYTAEREINKDFGEAVIYAMFGKVVALNQTLELCSIDEELLECPIRKGFRTYRREVVLPRFAPKGQYHGSALLRYAHTKETKLCAKGRMIL